MFNINFHIIKSVYTLFTNRALSYLNFFDLFMGKNLLYKLFYVFNDFLYINVKFYIKFRLCKNPFF